MNKPPLRDWLPSDSEMNVVPSKRRQRYLADKARRILSTFPRAVAMPEQDVVDLWHRIMQRIDVRVGGQVARSDTVFLYEYLCPSAVETTGVLPSPEGYVLLVEDHPGIGFRISASDLPPLDHIHLPDDTHIVPYPRPTWIVTVSHESPMLPPLQFDLRGGTRG